MRITAAQGRYRTRTISYSRKSIDRLTGSYIALIEEEAFLVNPSKYIENAYEKSQNLGGYDLTKQV